MINPFLFPFKFWHIARIYFFYIIKGNKRKQSLSKQKKERLGAHILHRASYNALKFSFNIQVEFVNEPLTSQPSIWVSNHVSYLDPILISSKKPVIFITSQEVREQFFLGYSCASVESHFIERRNRKNLQKEMQKIKNTLSNNISVHLFPEGTTGSGESILPFKSSFFNISHELKTPIQPIYLEYTHVNGKSINRSNKNLLYYYGNNFFFPHFMKLLCCHTIKARVTFLSPIDPNIYSNRKEIAQATFDSIAMTHQKSKLRNPSK